MPVSINDGSEAVKVKDNGDDNESLDVPPRWDKRHCAVLCAHRDDVRWHIRVGI